MSPATRLVLFGAVLAVLFAAAAAAGGALDPDARARPGAPPSRWPAPRTAAATPRTPAQRGRGRRSTASPSPTPGSSSTSSRPSSAAAASSELAFRVVDARGEPVRDYDVEHERRMHLIVVRRDLTGFQHLHPELRRRRHVGDADRAPRRGLLPRVRRLLPRRRRRRRSPPTCASTAPPTCARCPRRRRPPPPATATRSALDAGAVHAGERGGAALHGHARRRARRDGAVPGRRRPPGRAARGRPRLPARAPGRTASASWRRSPAPAATACSSSSSTRARSARPRSRRRWHDERRARPPRAADHGHDLRVVREPDRAQAQQARRRHAPA